MSREEALMIPAVSKARNLLVSTVASYPLIALDSDDQPLSDQPTFLYRTDAGSNPYARMAATVDDLVFYGRSLWLTERGAMGQIVRAERVPMADWSIRREGLYVGDVLLENDTDFLLFHIPLFAGLLEVGATTLRGARDTEKAWTARQHNPIFITELHLSEDANLTQDEVELARDQFVAKHKAGEPSLAVTPAGLEIRTHGGSGEADLFLEGRNAIRMDVAAFLNLPAVLMDASLSTASLTYTTTEGNRNLFLEQLRFWVNPIEAALSEDKAVPRGSRVRFQREEDYAPAPNPTGEPVDD